MADYKLMWEELKKALTEDLNCSDALMSMAEYHGIVQSAEYNLQRMERLERDANAC